MKTNIKKVLVALKDKDKENLESTFKAAIAYIDRAASKKVIHRNSAARRVSRLAKKVNTVLGEGQTQQ